MTRYIVMTVPGDDDRTEPTLYFVYDRQTMRSIAQAPTATAASLHVRHLNAQPPVYAVRDALRTRTLRVGRGVEQD